MPSSTLIDQLLEWGGWLPAAILLMVLILIDERRIRTLKDQIELILVELDDLKNYSGDQLIDRLINRHKAVSEELDELIKEREIDENQIKALEKEIRELRVESKKLDVVHFSDIHSLSSLNKHKSNIMVKLVYLLLMDEFMKNNTVIDNRKFFQSSEDEP